MSQHLPDNENELMRLAVQMVQETSRNIFLTGKAGTGKTTFLKFIRQNARKQMAVVAPTGVAAINAGGVTIHSFFQLPLSPFIPVKRLSDAGDNSRAAGRHELINHLRLNTEKRKIIQQLELLVIDEISMVRCDTLDAIDTILRHFRRRPHDAFGGVQALLIGDMMQLPPVIRDDEWTLLSDYYEGPYFFNSQVMRQEMPAYIEFDKIYRQSEQRFITLLNQVRNNCLDEEGMAMLDERYDPAFPRTPGDGYIVLTTHNEKARQINQGELSRLAGAEYIFESKVEGEFPERSYPADEKLILKEGAQVMFIRNDSSEMGRRYYNGRIGIVSRFAGGKIYVSCEGDEKEIEVSAETWENTRYTVNRDTNKLEQEKLGTFAQFPLRLAWAITIHKSQGLTFEKAIIDAGAAFAPGQVYVALSRCTSLEGLVLQTRINMASLNSDRRLVEFSERKASVSRLESEYQSARDHYHFQKQRELFLLNPLTALLSDTRIAILENRKHVNEAGIGWLESITQKLESLDAVGTRFDQQLQALNFANDREALKSRVEAAAIYFHKEYSALSHQVENCPLVSESFVQAKAVTEKIQELYSILQARVQVLSRADLSDIYSIQKVAGEYKSPRLRLRIYAVGDTSSEGPVHPALYRELKMIRDEICKTEDLPLYFVATGNTLNELVSNLPRTKKELRKIKGFGAVRVEKFGEKFLEPIRRFVEQNGLEEEPEQLDTVNEAPEEELKPKTKRVKGASLEVTRTLYREGKSPEEIAATRNLAVSTILQHLTQLVGLGEIKVEELVDEEKIARIRDAFEKNTDSTLTLVREQLGEDYSFAELHMVKAADGLVSDK